MLNEKDVPDFFATAAQASINGRCAPAFLHDVRGSMQALFSAFELLGRSARSGGDNAGRVERACDLARRAILHHEKSTMEVLELLTQQQAAAALFDVGPLVTDVIHFLRNDAASRGVTVALTAENALQIHTERTKFRTLLVGLVTLAIDRTPSGTELHVVVERRDHEALISIGSDGGYETAPSAGQWQIGSMQAVTVRDLTLLFATQFLTANFGRLEIDPSSPPRGAINIYHPCIKS